MVLTKIWLTPDVKNDTRSTWCMQILGYDRKHEARNQVTIYTNNHLKTTTSNSLEITEPHESSWCCFSLNYSGYLFCRVSEVSLSPRQIIRHLRHWTSNSSSILSKVKHNQRASANHSPRTGPRGGGHTFACTYSNQCISVITSFVLYGLQSSKSTSIRRKGKPNYVLTSRCEFEVSLWS